MRVPKTKLQFVVQGRYGSFGWEDLTAEDVYREGRQRLREYNENEREYPHRMIRRRVANPHFTELYKRL